MKRYLPNLVMFLVSLLFGIFYSIRDIPESIKPAPVAVSENKSLEAVYQVGFKLSKKTYPSINTYLAATKQTSFRQAQEIKEWFGVSGNLSDVGDLYYASDDKGAIKIYKEGATAKYFKYNDDLLYEPMQKGYIIGTALKFLDENNFIFNYEEALVNSGGDFYSINFIDRLNNIKNFSFPNKMILDKYGNIISLEVNFAEYKRLNSVKSVSMEEAFMKLPDFYGHDAKIFLDGAELAYFYGDSIIQPAYRFYGSMENGGGFECFIEAADYD
ncbi:MAG: hypothetical protein LBV08_04410 [Clostridiales bacterium]|jgi:hypothetical protein|nr:hypothetical protein [Clostridiales bacterium]